jgi:hypothetical protein
MENRVVEFGYSSNLGGVEVFIKNIIMNTSIPIDLVATTQDKIPLLKTSLSQMEVEYSEYRIGVLHRWNISVI